MAFESIRVGDKLEIIDMHNPDNVGASKVYDIPDPHQKLILITIPKTPLGKVFNLEFGASYTVQLLVDDKPHFYYKGTFVQYIEGEDEVCASIRILSDGERKNRRRYFRFSCALPMKYSILDFGDSEVAKILHNSGYSELYDGVIRDIGGGGIRFTTNQDISKDIHIQCRILLGRRTIVMKAKLIKKEYIPKAVTKYQYRCEFLEISAAMREEIVNFIFLEQRKHQRRELP